MKLRKWCVDWVTTTRRLSSQLAHANANAAAFTDSRTQQHLTFKRQHETTKKKGIDSFTEEKRGVYLSLSFSCSVIIWRMCWTTGRNCSEQQIIRLTDPETDTDVMFSSQLVRTEAREHFDCCDWMLLVSTPTSQTTARCQCVFFGPVLVLLSQI